MQAGKLRCHVATDDAIRQRVTGVLVEVCSISVHCVPGDRGTDLSREIEATRTKKGGKSKSFPLSAECLPKQTTRQERPARVTHPCEREQAIRVVR